MKAFISYNHNDEAMLEVFHKHLAQLKRDDLIQTWEDRAIMAGGKLDDTISTSLEQSQLFLALLSADYIASNYCYEKEFARALEKVKEGTLIIVPIIIESCDWLQTPFKQFKALPKDGKAISLWANKNTAFLDVTQNLRKVLEGNGSNQGYLKPEGTKPTRNYRVQKEFDTIEKIEFLEKTFTEIKDYLKRYINEIKELDNIKVKQVKEDNMTFQYILVNRNKINTEAHLTVTTGDGKSRGGFWGDKKAILFTIEKSNNPANRVFHLDNDEYELFWRAQDQYGFGTGEKKLTSKDISDIIYNEWLVSVGIIM